MTEGEAAVGMQHSDDALEGLRTGERKEREGSEQGPRHGAVDHEVSV